VYLPHSSYPDEEVELVYEQLDTCLRGARAGKLQCAIAGDFNAQVGKQDDHDDPSIIGEHGFGERNTRGDWLLQWCTFHRLVLANTYFGAYTTTSDTIQDPNCVTGSGINCEESWTYRNNLTYRQLDYFLLDRGLFSKTEACGVNPRIHTGSDHRAVLLALAFLDKDERKASKRRYKDKAWHIDVRRYQQELDSCFNCHADREAQLCQQNPSTEVSNGSKHIETSMLKAAEHSRMETVQSESATHPEDLQIRDLIAKRRSLNTDSTLTREDKISQQKDICKQIQKTVRKREKLRRNLKIDTILKEFKGLKDIAAIKGSSQKKPIASITDPQGNIISEKVGVANVFAEFYERLYASQSGSGSWRTRDAPAFELIPITLQELTAALGLMKRGRAMDESGVIAEMLKDGSQTLLAAILDLFNDVLSLRQQPPAEWRKTKLIVIFKKGDPTCPGNYRPIAILPILYKLFSRILCERLQVYLMPQQSVDQAAYRKGFSTEDHLFTVAQLIERSHEFNFNLWLGLVDFEKAFDMVEHTQLWETLLDQGVPQHYVLLLSLLYADQVATVQTDARSRSFKISRGVKQGDPVSALLFIAVMQACFGELQTKWTKLNCRRKGHGFGISLCANTRNLTDLRFADDVILVAQSKADVAKMLHHLHVCSANLA